MSKLKSLHLRRRLFVSLSRLHGPKQLLFFFFDKTHHKDKQTNERNNKLHPNKIKSYLLGTCSQWGSVHLTQINFFFTLITKTFSILRNNSLLDALIKKVHLFSCLSQINNERRTFFLLFRCTSRWCFCF